MCGLHIGDYGQIGVAVEKTLITLICLEYHPVILKMAHIGAKLLTDGTDKGIGVWQDRGQHR